MSEMRNYTAGQFITEFVQLEIQSEPTQVISHALDGTTYIQNIGDPIKTMPGTAYVTREQRALLDAANANGDVIKVTLSRGDFYGRLIALKYGDRMPQNYFKATFTLSKEAIP